MVGQRVKIKFRTVGPAAETVGGHSGAPLVHERQRGKLAVDLELGGVAASGRRKADRDHRGGGHVPAAGATAGVGRHRRQPMRPAGKAQEAAGCRRASLGSASGGRVRAVELSVPPPSRPAAIVGAAVGIASDGMAFTALLLTSLSLRIDSPWGASPGSAAAGVALTALAVAGSTAVEMAARSGARRRRRWLALAAAAAAALAALQGRELVGAVAGPRSGLALQAFIVVAGAHALHVAVAAAILAWRAARPAEGSIGPFRLALHYLALVWAGIFSSLLRRLMRATSLAPCPRRRARRSRLSGARCGVPELCRRRRELRPRSPHRQLDDRPLRGRRVCCPGRPARSESAGIVSALRAAALIGLPVDASAEGWRVERILEVSHIFTAVLGAAALLWLAWPLLAHRRGPPADFRGQTWAAKLVPLVLGGIVFFVVDGTLYWLSMRDLDAVVTGATRDRPGDLRVEVNARQWSWEFRYAGSDGRFASDDDVVTSDRLVVPEDRRGWFSRWAPPTWSTRSSCQTSAASATSFPGQLSPDGYPRDAPRDL